MKRIEDKIGELNKFLDNLESIAPSSLEEYKSSIEKKAACERFIEKIAEALVDLAFLAIKESKFEIPQDDADAFNILLNRKTINKGMADRLKSAKGMRNILAHQYGEVDDEIVFHAITEEIGKDAREFMEIIKKLNKKNI